MKDQYFGDENDYRKYGLLRALQRELTQPLLVVWMLTPDDGSNDGRKTDYLRNPRSWSAHDPELFQFLERSIGSASRRGVAAIEAAALIPRAHFFGELVPDGRSDRSAWSDRMTRAARGCGLVFLDPDNGIEIKSRPIGQKGSSKYLAWSEIEASWNIGASVLVYQHFPRIERSSFVQLRLSEIRGRLAASVVLALRTANVAFFLAAQREHAAELSRAAESIEASWHGQFEIVRAR